ncbi:MAG: hypothetical protein WBH14_02795 [Albidovulum sp.]
MSRHITDRSTSPESGRLKHFLDVERRQGAAGSHPAAKTVHARSLPRKTTARIRAFMRIERGQTA